MSDPGDMLGFVRFLSAALRWPMFQWLFGESESQRYWRESARQQVRNAQLQEMSAKQFDEAAKDAEADRGKREEQWRQMDEDNVRYRAYLTLAEKNQERLSRSMDTWEQQLQRFSEIMDRWDKSPTR